MSKEETKKVVSFQDAVKAREEQETIKLLEADRVFDIPKEQLKKFRTKFRFANPKWFDLVENYPNNEILKKILHCIHWMTVLITFPFKTPENKKWFLRECEVAFEALEYPLEDGTIGPKMLTEFTNPQFFSLGEDDENTFSILLFRILEMPGNKKFMHIRMKDGSNHFKMPI